ncbi:hypothetical protein ACFL1V_09450 [Pseudomonadota bacterium]
MNTLSDWISESSRRARKPASGLAITLSVLIMSACSGQATKQGDPGKVVVERAQNRWDTLLAGDYESAYAYYSPGYRSTKSVIDFAIDIRSRRVRWTSAEYLDHSCSESACTVRFNVGFVVNKPVPGLDKWESSSVIEDKWIKTEAQWWYLPKK